jgi:hypothetical protein
MVLAGWRLQGMRREHAAHKGTHQGLTSGRPHLIAAPAIKDKS